jgi:hypothetical protein
MKIPLITSVIILIAMVMSCDIQSEIAKKSVEKYGPTPTPSIFPTPPEEPIDPADVVEVDTGASGPLIQINSAQDKMNLVCDKYNRVMVNGAPKVVRVKGGCSQIMLNGNGHEVTAEAASEIVFNGADNKVRYWRYVNGKRPVVTDNKRGNVSEKVAAPSKK